MTNFAYVVDGVCMYMKPDCAYVPLLIGILCRLLVVMLVYHVDKEARYHWGCGRATVWVILGLNDKIE